MKRTVAPRPTFAAAFVLGVVAVLAATAGPAWAHEEITPSTVTTGTPTFLTLRAPNEKTVELITVTLTSPAGVPLGEATRQPDGWTAQRSGQAITWSGGQLAPEGVDEWTFEIEGAEQAGTLAFKIALGYADGTSEEAEADVTATGPGVPATTRAPATTAVAGAPTTVAGPSSAAPVAEKEDADEGRANAALVVAIIAGVLALVAIGLAVSRKGSSKAGPSDADAGETQNW